MKKKCYKSLIYKKSYEDFIEKLNKFKVFDFFYIETCLAATRK